MVEIHKQKDLQKLRSLPFCYICGESLPSTKSSERNRDHLPPTTIFKVEDRVNPLILPTHEGCNHAEGHLDEQIGQLIGIHHGRSFDPRKFRLRISEFDDPLGRVGLVHVDLEPAIWRWVRGFHAALYREHLPNDAHKHIQPPMTAGRHGDDGLVTEEVLPQQFDYVEIIERNRSLGRLDRIVTRAGKCIYECVWIDVLSPAEAHACIFALRIYDWSDLGLTGRTERRGCTGVYGTMHLPAGATAEVQEPNRRVSGSLDPFA
ncbi:MAG: hypothetical protein WEF99_15565 [Thermoanaerobaculia bacterium]